MDENVFATFLLDKAESFGVVKPFNSSFCQRTSPPFYIENCTSDRKKGKNRKFRFLPYRLFRPIVQETKQHILNTWAQIPIIQRQRYPLSSQKSTFFQKKSSILNCSSSEHHLSFFRVLRLIFWCYGAPDQELFAQRVHKILVDPPP